MTTNCILTLRINAKRESMERRFVYQHLSPEATLEIQQTFRWPLHEDSSWSKVFSTWIQSIALSGVKVQSPTFSLDLVLRDNEIDPFDEVFVNWGLFTDIDRIELPAMHEFFAKLWIEGTDQIEIFDATFSWLLAIAPDGSCHLKILK